MWKFVILTKKLIRAHKVNYILLNGKDKCCTENDGEEIQLTFMCHYRIQQLIIVLRFKLDVFKIQSRKVKLQTVLFVCNIPEITFCFHCQGKMWRTYQWLLKCFMFLQKQQGFIILKNFSRFTSCQWHLKA
jgi:hypothetical protein